MATSYKHLRCPGCDGTLKYVKEKKVWECIYCGNEIRREEEYDGLYTIKNVVKQVLVDLAYNRMDTATKNLVECQKISSDYVGTLIAEICLKVFTLITPGACQQSEIKGIFGQVKRLYMKLESVADGGISTEEEALYEAFDENGDAFGVLVLVYDTLQAQAHLQFVLDLFDVSYVYSKSLNANLLNYALKNEKPEIADKIFANSDNINCHDAFFVCLNSYEDSNQKRQRLIPIMEKAEFRQDDYKKIDTYLTNTMDGIETKIMIYEKSVSYGIAPPMQCVVEHILNEPNISDMQISDVYKAFCATKPKDAELYDLITDIYIKHKGENACKEMQELVNNDIFIKMSDKLVRGMVVRKDLTVDERIKLLEHAEQCKLSPKDNDAIITEILLRVDESFENRIALVKTLIEYIDTISTNSLTEYIVNSTVDGDKKPEMLEELFKLNLNMSFFRDVLNNYIKYSKDSSETKNAVTQLLSNSGIGVDSNMLLDIACEANETNYMEKADFIQKSINNGTRVNADSLSLYLERVSVEKYRSELISLLTTPISRITDKALANYVLFSEDPMEIKLQNAIVFAEKNGKTFGESECEVKHLNSTIRCNLFQGYVLAADDSSVTVQSIVGAMKQAKAKLNAPILVNGKSQKFKKYITDNKSQLSQMTITLCEENNVFSFFF
ncbi:hypothetical protein ACTNEF_14715 [Bariatricus sp. HCP28S3_E4]|uniref:hypothetical protein n=1 Tax=unclassified Bariatricus TaxID=2677046 RepID=UPI003F8C3CF8